MTKFLRGHPPVDGVNPRKLPERLCTWPRGLRTSLPVLRFVSMVVMLSDDIFTNLTKTENDSNELEHCLATGVGVRYRSAGKSKWKSQIMARRIGQTDIRQRVSMGRTQHEKPNSPICV